MAKKLIINGKTVRKLGRIYMAIIGIDLGTTNSVMAVYKEDQTTVIPNRLNELLTPSIVSLDEEGQIIVGKVAKERQITHPQLTVAAFKRHMGSQKEYILGEKKFLPEELSSFVLRAMKEDAEAYLGESVTEAIISVPAYFNDIQRKATKRAAQLADLKVERLINEPTAAAIAYGLHEQKEHTKFLVFDLGGGTFDVSILERYNNIMEVRGVAGDNYLGGEDFTQILMQLFAKAHEMTLETMEPKTLALLKKEAEVAKRAFGRNKNITMKCKINDEILEHEVSLEAYEKACELLLARLRRPIERALKDAAIKVKDIDAVVLIGGATKLPIIRTFVSKLFGRLPNMQIDPDQTVAVGAAIQAAMKAREKSIKEVVLTDVCPYSLGTSVCVRRQSGRYEGGYFYPIIERNTIIPVSRVERFYTSYDRQTNINVDILQGESRMARDNISLGEINVKVPAAPAGKEAIDVRYTYDINGLLQVEVKVLSTGLEKSMIIEKNPGYMSQEEIQERLEELSEIKIHPRDKEENKLLKARCERIYEESIGTVRYQIAELLRMFDEALDSQDERKIEASKENLTSFLTEMDNDYDF